MPAVEVERGLKRLSTTSALRAILKPDPGSAFGRVAALESSQYMRNQLLRDTDWASMAHGLEVRVPLVDHVLLNRIGAMRGKFGWSGKEILARAPSTPLPNHVVRRPKTGFTTPVSSWMHGSRNSAAASSQPWARDWSRKVVASARNAA